MKKFINKSILFILCFSLIFTAVPILAADNESGGFEPAEYTDAISMLSELGIISDTDFAKYDASVQMTRGELASLAVAVLGLSKEANAITYDNRFSDVTADNKYAKDIIFATSIGLFNGVSNTEFAPDEPVYINQALKVVVSMLGYKEMAEYKGGYPTGYLAIARDVDILDGVVLNNESAALRGNVIVLMYNTLFADIMNVVGIDGESFSYEITEGMNILSYYHKITEEEGIVTANWQNAIIGDVEEANYLVVNGKRFYTESSRAIGSVGKNVKYYYTRIGSKDILLTLRESDNNIINFKANDDYSFDYAKGEYSLSTSDKNFVFKVSDFDIIYNYGPVSGNTPVDYEKILSPKSGSITLIDNNMDKIYDVVIIEDPDIVLFSSYDSYSNKIYDKTDRKRDIKLDDYSPCTVSDMNGNLVDFAKLNANAVIMVYKSIDSKSIKLVVCDSIAEGKVEELSNDEVLINSLFYKFSSNARLEGMLPGQTYASVIKAGESYKFYLDQYNEIVYHEVLGSSNHGYLVKVAQSGNGIESSIQAQIFTSDGKLEVFNLADKVRIETINGRATYSTAQVQGKLAELVVQMYGVDLVNPDSRIFVQYGLNSNKEISSFTLPHVLDSESEYKNPPSNYNFFKLDYIISKCIQTGINQSNGTYRLGWTVKNRSAGFTMTFDSTAQLFYVPEITNTNYLDTNFTFRDVNSLGKDDSLYFAQDFAGKNNHLEAFSTGGDVRLVNAVVWYKTSGLSTSISNDYDHNCLVKAVSIVSDQGEERVKLTLFDSKSEVTVFAKDKTVIDKASFGDTIVNGETPVISANKTTIVPGDIIKYSLDSEGLVDDIALFYDSQNSVGSYPYVKTFTKNTIQCRHTWGNITDMYAGYAVINAYDSIGGSDNIATTTVDEPILASSFPKVFVYDYESDEARLGATEDISIGDKVYYTMYYGEAREIFVYKGGN